MSLTIYPDVIQGSDEWHDQRRGIVTASVVGQLINIGAPDALTIRCRTCDAEPSEPCVSMAVKRKTPIKTLHPQRSTDVAEYPPVIAPANNDTSRGLTALLVAERITGHTDPTYINNDMLRGIEDEPRAVEKYAEHYAHVETVGFMVRDDWGYLIGYSPDGLVGDDGLIEVKSRRQKAQLQTILDDEVPAANMAQLQAGLLVSERKWVDYVSYCGGMPLYVKRVWPDLAWFKAIVAAVATFELTATRMVADYQFATQGLATTERVIEQEIF